MRYSELSAAGHGVTGSSVSNEVESWRQEQLRRSAFSVAALSMDRLTHWSLSEGRLAHSSGGFFSVVGLKFSDWHAAGETAWQPFILQPEIGTLGFMLCRRDAEAWLLVQAKIEPGNPGGAQLAPSFQCTESNYLRRHGGICAPFYDFFHGPEQRARLTDSLQSEQGTRFVDKYNRNVVIEVEADAVDLEQPFLSAWRWLPFREIQNLILEDLLFNTDARSVIAVSDWEIFCSGQEPFGRWAGQPGFGQALWKSYHQPTTAAQTAETGRWLDARRKAFSSSAQLVSLADLRGWRMAPSGISSEGPSTVAVKYYEVQALDREVPRWSQPLITSSSEGLVMIIAQEQAGLLKFLVRVSHEPGFANAAQLSASFQTFPGDARQADTPLALLEQWEQASGGSAVQISCQMSEEGGRFYHDINRYLLVLAPAGHRFAEDDDSRWLTLAEITALKRTPGVFTNEFRSALSLLVHYL